MEVIYKITGIMFKKIGEINVNTGDWLKKSWCYVKKGGIESGIIALTMVDWKMNNMKRCGFEKDLRV